MPRATRPLKLPYVLLIFRLAHDRAPVARCQQKFRGEFARLVTEGEEKLLRFDGVVTIEASGAFRI
jgi:hypothetical protein